MTAETTLAYLPIIYTYFGLIFSQVKPSLASPSVFPSRDPLLLEPLAPSLAESMAVGSLGGPNHPAKCSLKMQQVSSLVRAVQGKTAGKMGIYKVGHACQARGICIEGER